MNKGVIIGLTLLLVLFLASCNIPGRPSVDEQGRPISGAIHVGTQGVDIKFFAGLPRVIYEDTTVDLLLEVRNRGTYPLQGMKMFLTGHDPNLIQFRETQKLINLLEPKAISNPDGGFTTTSFASSRIALPPGVDFYRPTFVISACYKYQTDATPIVCVDPDPLSPIQDKACTPGVVSGLGGGQGAPVAVSSIQQDSLPGKVRFKINIANVGNGKVANLQKCPFDLDFATLNNVRYTVSLGRNVGECQPSSPLKLLDGNTATIFCTFNLQGQSAFTTPLEITLLYDYLSTVKFDLEIRKIQWRIQ